jgi:hypothetical protein
MKNIKNNDTIAGLVVFLIGIYILIESIKLMDVGEYYDSPGLLPAIISVVIILSSSILIWNAIRRELKGSTVRVKNNHFDIQKEPLLNSRIIMIIIIITLYVVFLDYTNFLISSISFLFILMCYLKSTNLLKITIISVVVPILIQYVFKNIFNQIIP